MKRPGRRHRRRGTARNRGEGGSEKESGKQPARPEILLDGGGNAVLVQLLGGDLLIGRQGAGPILCFFAQRAPRAHN
eukprot:COSAG01_NODE_9048_length_2570_cov_21.338729_3_plen_77_part_00